MELRPIYLLLFASIITYAQTGKDEKALLKANQAIQDVNSQINAVPTACASATPSEKQELLMEEVCTAPSVEPKNESPLQIREFKSLDQLPSGLKGLAKKFNLAPGQPIKILLRESNDAIFTPLGYLAMIVEPEMEDYHKPDYDLGNTHTMSLEASKTSLTGTTYRLYGSTGLYTISDGTEMYLDEQQHKHQGIYFTEKNVFGFLADNDQSAIGKKDKLLWKAGAGIQSMNSTHPTSAGASGQQDIFHHAANTKGQMPYYTYVSDGKPTRTSGFMDLGVGMSHQIARNASCQVRVVGSVNAKVFTTPNFSTLTANTYTEANLKKKKYTAAFRAGANTTVHQNGVEFTPILTASYERKRWGVENTVIFPTGKLENSANYNFRAHPMNTLAIFVYVARGKKK